MQSTYIINGLHKRADRRIKKKLDNYKKQLEETLSPDDADASNRFRCWNCQCDDFYVESGFYMCESCDSSNGHALGYYDMKEYDRFHYRRKSIYQIKYHYENKVKDISKRILLTDDEQYSLYNKLMEIDQETITKINEHCKRMISVFYLIKKNFSKKWDVRNTIKLVLSFLNKHLLIMKSGGSIINLCATPI